MESKQSNGRSSVKRKSSASVDEPSSKRGKTDLAGAFDWNDTNALITFFTSEFDALVQEFVVHMREDNEMDEAACTRVATMIKTTTLGGKMYRGLLVLHSTRSLCDKRSLDFDQRWRRAVVLGWCIEVLQAMFLVADDIMDASVTRRGKPCWYKRPEVQMDAINDSFILRSFLFFMLRKNFSTDPCYVQYFELFNEVTCKTELGQMLDLLSQPQGQKNPQILNKFSGELHRKIVVYKTAYYTFYLPIASAMILCGLTEPTQMKLAEKVCVELGEKFQIEDDYLDCFGDPAVLGKVGTDIQDHKCSWLVVQALLRVSAAQKRLLEAHYGKEDVESVRRIKQLYEELGLPAVYAKQEEDSYKKIKALITANDHVVPAVVFEGILDKIHGRQK